MPKRSSIFKDINLMAAKVLATVTDSAEKEPEKNPAAVALGRMGGLRGGNARAKMLSPQRRKAIAKKAAIARWSKSRG